MTKTRKEEDKVWKFHVKNPWKNHPALVQCYDGDRVTLQQVIRPDDLATFGPLHGDAFFFIDRVEITKQ